MKQYVFDCKSITCSRILVNVLSAVIESLNWHMIDENGFHHDVKKIQFVNIFTVAAMAILQYTKMPKQIWHIKHNYLIEENTRDHDNR